MAFFFCVGEDTKRRYPVTVLVFLTKLSPQILTILGINIIIRDNKRKWNFLRKTVLVIQIKIENTPGKFLITLTKISTLPCLKHLSLSSLLNSLNGRARKASEEQIGFHRTPGQGLFQTSGAWERFLEAHF